MKYSIKCAVIYLGGHVCMQFHTWQITSDLLTFLSMRTKNNTERFWLIDPCDRQNCSG